jgi:hypothetical protein
MIKGHAHTLQKIQIECQNKRLNNVVQKTTSKWQFPQKKQTSYPLVAKFTSTWYDRVSFQVCDAAKYMEKYRDSFGNDISHIYSYNKVMSPDDRREISKILNRTNFKIMAWYFGPRESA